MSFSWVWKNVQCTVYGEIIPFRHSMALVLSLPSKANHIINSTFGGAIFTQTLHTNLSMETPWSATASILLRRVLTEKFELSHHKVPSVLFLTGESALS